MEHKFTVHRNGDTYETLKEQHLAVVRKARELEEVLRKAAPNGRNYYVKSTGEEDLRNDTNEFRAVMQKLADISKWAEAGAMHAYEQAGV